MRMRNGFVKGMSMQEVQEAHGTLSECRVILVGKTDCRYSERTNTQLHEFDQKLRTKSWNICIQHAVCLLKLSVSL